MDIFTVFALEDFLKIPLRKWFIFILNEGCQQLIKKNKKQKKTNKKKINQNLAREKKEAKYFNDNLNVFKALFLKISLSPAGSFIARKRILPRVKVYKDYFHTELIKKNNKNHATLLLLSQSKVNAPSLLQHCR